MPVEIPQFNALVGSPDPMVLLISLAFFFGIMIVGFRKKQTPIYLAGLNFLMIFMIYVSIGTASSFWAMATVLIASGLMVVIANRTFLGNYGGETKIFISYLIFFMLTFTLFNYMNVSSLIFGGVKSVSMNQCTLGLVIIDGLFLCGYNYLSMFWQFITFNSTISIINGVLITPFAYFIVKYMSDWLRGRGAQ